VMAAAAVLPLTGAAVAFRVHRPPVGASEARGDGLLAATLLPGIGLTLVNLGYVAVLTFGSAVSATGLIVPVFAALVILARLAGGSVPDRAGARPTVVASTAVAAVGLGGLALVHAPVPGLAATAVVAAGQALAVPALGLLALDRVSAARHGAAAGLFFAFFDAGVGAGGLLVGGVARLTSPAGAIAVAGAGVLGAGLLQLSRPARSRTRR
jgi:MFS family permease